MQNLQHSRAAAPAPYTVTHTRTHLFRRELLHLSLRSPPRTADDVIDPVQVVAGGDLQHAIQRWARGGGGRRASRDGVRVALCADCDSGPEWAHTGAGLWNDEIEKTILYALNGSARIALTPFRRERYRDRRQTRAETFDTFEGFRLLAPTDRSGKKGRKAQTQQKQEQQKKP